MYLDVRPDEFQYLPFSFCHLVLATSNCFPLHVVPHISIRFPNTAGHSPLSHELWCVQLVSKCPCVLLVLMGDHRPMLIKEPLSQRFKLYMRTNEITKNIYPPHLKNDPFSYVSRETGGWGFPLFSL
jgi:hypothetical protein